MSAKSQADLVALVRFIGKLPRAFAPTGCVAWPWYKDPAGYGRMHFRGEVLYAHRLAYQAFNGPLEDGMQVMHSCDNPGCVNPRHLSKGTVLDNQRDSIAKGRHAHGERAGGSKLRAEDVLQIRVLLERGRTLTQVAKHYRVHRQTIADIRDGKTWSHV